MRESARFWGRDGVSSHLPSNQSSISRAPQSSLPIQGQRVPEMVVQVAGESFCKHKTHRQVSAFILDANIHTLM